MTKRPAVNKEVAKAIHDYLLGMADDELILGHRNSEWCGHAPILEEDIAFANIALDEIGHAVLWYELAAEAIGESMETYPDKLVYGRPVREFRSSLLVEQHIGDWAFTILRQFLFDSYEIALLRSLVGSAHDSLAARAAKVKTEEAYHLLHTTSWVERLGKGTKESHRRLQAALDRCWPLCRQLFHPSKESLILADEDILGPAESIEARWNEDVEPILESSGLVIREVRDARILERSEHSEHLSVLLTELQAVARAYPGVEW